MQATPEQYAKALYEALQSADDSKQSGIITNFLHNLQQTGRLRWLSDIVRVVDTLEQSSTGKTRVTVTLAHEASEETVQQLVKQFVAADNASVQVKLDPAMIGGFEVETDNQRWVGSLAAQLQQLKRTLRSHN